jgi:hypothetical protein
MVNLPGCHGSAVAVSALSPTCQSCGFARSCVGEAGAFLLTLPATPITTRARKSLAVTARALLSKPQTAVEGEGTPEQRPAPTSTRAPLTAAEESLLACLAKRVRSQAKTLMETGWFDFARGELAAGRNPADKGWRHIFCQQLLAGSATRASLRAAFAEQLDLTPQSAKVQMSTAVSIFAAGQLAVESGGVLRLIAKGVDRP